MTNFILQPCADTASKKHFHTVVDGVTIASIKKYLPSPVTKQLKEFYSSGICPVWGIEEKTGINVARWERVNPGDVTFFYRNKKLIAWGIVTLKIRNRRLSRHLWGQRKNGSTWEYMYFLKDIQHIDIPIDGLNLEIGYEATSPVRAFSVLDDIRGQLALDYFELAPPTDPAPKQPIIPQEERKLLSMQLTDGIGSSRPRLEQKHLRKILFGGKKEAACGICGKIFLISFLATAHIKMRSWCSETERTNKHVVMPLCKMGCDHLYEYGYVSIIAGKVTVLQVAPLNKSITNYLARIARKNCPFFTKDSEAFFKWHYQFHTEKKNKLKQLENLLQHD